MQFIGRAAAMLFCRRNDQRGLAAAGSLGGNKIETTRHACARPATARDNACTPESRHETCLLYKLLRKVPAA